MKTENKKSNIKTKALILSVLLSLGIIYISIGISWESVDMIRNFMMVVLGSVSIYFFVKSLMEMIKDE